MFDCTAQPSNCETKVTVPVSIVNDQLEVTLHYHDEILLSEVVFNERELETEVRRIGRSRQVTFVDRYALTTLAVVGAGKGPEILLRFFVIVFCGPGKSFVYCCLLPYVYLSAAENATETFVRLFDNGE